MLVLCVYTERRSETFEHIGCHDGMIDIFMECVTLLKVTKI